MAGTRRWPAAPLNIAVFLVGQNVTLAVPLDALYPVAPANLAVYCPPDRRGRAPWQVATPWLSVVAVHEDDP